MSTTNPSSLKVIPSRRAVIIAAIAFVSIVLAASYIWIMIDQTIAPPSLRILDFLWRAFTWLRA